MAVAALGHGALVASVVGAILVSSWAIPLQLLCVWFAGNIAGNRGRNRNIGHALGMWLGVLGLFLALGLDSTNPDAHQQKITTARVFVFTIVGIAVVGAFPWFIAALASSSHVILFVP